MCAKRIDLGADWRGVHEPRHLVGKAVRFPDISPERRREIRALADELRKAEPRIGDTGAFGGRVHIGFGGGPAILFGDNG